MPEISILDLIPDNLKQKLIDEVKALMSEQEKIDNEKKMRETKASAEEIEKIINHIM